MSNAIALVVAGKRVLWRVVAAFVLGVGALLVCSASPVQAWADDAPVPATSKTIVANGDGTYNITLSVTGAVSQSHTTQYNAADVVIVLDISRSMFDNTDPVTGQAYIDNARSAIQSLTASLLTSDNAALPYEQQVQVALVSFDTRAQIEHGWTNSSQAITNAANGIAYTGGFSRGGTNWEDGINRANALDTGRGADKYIVFMSDGRPTYRVNHYSFRNANGWLVSVSSADFVRYYQDPAYTYVGVTTAGTGSSQQPAAELEANIQAGIDAANRRGNGVRFYSVSVQAEATGPMQRLASESGGAFYDGTDGVKLEEAFADIVEDIRKSISFQDVTITDQLSRHVEFVSSPPTFTVTQTGPDGAAMPWTGPQPTVEGDTVSWGLGEGFVLEDGVTYSITFTVAPNQATYDEAAEGAAPDEGTGAYAGMFGFNTNAEGTITYYTLTETTGQEPVVVGPETAEFDKPVITDVAQSQIDIELTWVGRDPTQTPVDVRVVRDDGKEYTVTLQKGADDRWVGAITVPAGPVGYTYTVSPVDLGDDWAVSYAASVDSASTTSQVVSDRAVRLVGVTEQHAAVTVTATYRPFALVLLKLDKDNSDIALPGAGFALYADTDGNGVFSPLIDLPASTYGDSGLSVPVSGSLFTGSDGRVSFYGLMPGSYWVVETAAPAGYQLLSRMPLLVIGEDGSMTIDGGTGAAPVAVQDRTGSITVSDEKIAVLPAAGGPGVLWLYVLGCGAVAFGCAALFSQRQRRRGLHVRR